MRPNVPKLKTVFVVDDDTVDQVPLAAAGPDARPEYPEIDSSHIASAA
ncbi:hypothetical protein [Nocardia cyriacigeorgica]|nr:hypothetical protein [Nocardia cyriacigeorgica]